MNEFGRLNNLSAILLALAFCCFDAQDVSALTRDSSPAVLPVSGKCASPQLNALDQAMTGLMKKYKISAGELAVGKNGKITYSKAFGFSDKERKIPTKTTNLFRLASCSKPITAVTIMTLVEQGKLKLDDKALDILSDMKPPDKEPFDARINQITVRQLLEHNSGFSNKNDDPQFAFLRAAAFKYHESPPASPQSIVRYRLTQPLDRNPGTKHEYSNFGYNMLGRIIEHKTGAPYEDYVKKNILAPAGITDMVIGKARLKDKLDSEVYYDDGDPDDTGWSIYSDEPLPVARSYGSYGMEAMDSHGGWLATAEDLVKFCSAADGSNPGCKLLKPSTIKIMTAAPEVKAPEKKGNYYAKGWDVFPARGEFKHSGALTWGVSSYVCHMPGDVQVACVFNHLPSTGDFFPALEEAIFPVIRNFAKSQGK